MKLWNLEIIFIDKLTIKDFQTINKLNLQFKDDKIDETDLWNELMKLMIHSINWKTDKQEIEDIVLWMTSLEDYTKINEEIANKINSFTDPLKKKN